MPLGRMTPRDTAELWRRAATGTLLDRESSRLAMRLARNPRTANRIPRLLASRPGYAWAGKTGTMSGVRADSGVLTTPKGTFVFAIFADRIPGVPGASLTANNAMGEIARDVVDAWSRDLPDARQSTSTRSGRSSRLSLASSRRPSRRAREGRTSNASTATPTGSSGSSGRRPGATSPTPASSRCRARSGKDGFRRRSSPSPPSSSTIRRWTTTSRASPSSSTRELRLVALSRRAGRAALPVRLARAPRLARGRVVPPRPVGPEPDLGRRGDHGRREPDSLHACPGRDRGEAHRRPDGAAPRRGPLDRRARACRPGTQVRPGRPLPWNEVVRRGLALAETLRPLVRLPRSRGSLRPGAGAARAQAGTTPRPGADGRSHLPSFRTSPFQGSFATRRFPSRSSQS